MSLQRCLRALSPLVVLSAGGCTAQETPTELPDLPANAVSVPFEQVEQVTSPIGGPAEPARQAIRDEGSWTKFWLELTSVRVPPDDPPAVDFTSQMVLVAAMGRRSTAGYRISIEGVYESEGRLFVDVVEVAPGVGCMLAQMVTAPVTAALIRAHDGPVQFMERRQREACA